MKISTRARYGVRVMIFLGLRFGEGPVLLREMAEDEGISEKYLSQIILHLKAKGLVNSIRGSKGGYVLARSPKDIHMNEVFSALEGPFDLLDCIGKPSECTRMSICTSRELWMELGKAMEARLKSISLKHLVNQCRKKQNVIDYAI